jgi:hypothetical protein
MLQPPLTLLQRVAMGPMQGCTAAVVREQAAIMSYARAAYLAALMLTHRPSLARGQSAVSRGARRPTATRVKMPHFNRCESLNSANATGDAWAEKHGPRESVGWMVEILAAC